MRDIRLLLHALLERPALIEHVAETLAELEIPDPALAELRDALVDAGEREETIDKLSLERHLETFGADLTASWVRDGFAWAEAPVLLRDHWSDADALTAWKREAALHHQRRSRPDERRDLKDAALAGVDANDREHERRFAAAARGLTAGEEEAVSTGEGGEAARERFDAAIGALEAAHAHKKGKRRV
jgi:hypothetical protein